MIGQTLGHYRVLELLGKGGMGEVYRAEDTTLGRQVAIKVLPQEFTENAERLARFEREAKLLATLNHPHIAQIHALEAVDGQRLLVMELVEGETLSERLSKGSLPVEAALPIALQITQALEAAHERGIVHRDLKPANIKLTPGGEVKVLDFGLAKPITDAASGDLSHSPTLTCSPTRAGVLLGTASYMSPEQARGQEVDRRTDIWSFGVVLWEMLTGRHLFEGETVSDILAGVLKEEPSWDRLPADLPRPIQRLLHRCLTRDLKERLHDIADARLEIEEAVAHPNRTAGGSVEPPQASSLWYRLRTAWWALPAVAGVAVLLTSLFLLMHPISDESDRALARLSVTVPQGGIPRTGLRPSFAVSPDGKWLVFALREGTEWKLFRRASDRFEVTPIPGIESAFSPFFSPNGDWVGYWDYLQRKLKKIPLEGGTSVTLADADNLLGASWGSSDAIVYVPEDAAGIWRVSAVGGEPELLLSPSVELGAWDVSHPEFLPDGSAILFSGFRGLTSSSGFIGLLEIDSRETKILIDHGTIARYVPTGHLIYQRADQVEVVPFNMALREVTGPAAQIPEAIQQGRTSGFSNLAFSREGSLFYLSGSASREWQLVSIDLEGKEAPLLDSLRHYVYPRYSPRGDQLAVTVFDRDGTDLWVVDLKTGVEAKLTSGGGVCNSLWAPDGDRIIFARDTSDPALSVGLFVQKADGSASQEVLLAAGEPGEQLWPFAVSQDGGLLVYAKSNPFSMGIDQEIWILEIDSGETRQFLASEGVLHTAAALSPDGGWIAYAADYSGEYEIYVDKFPQGGQRHKISRKGGLDPTWSPEGHGLYFAVAGQMMSAPVSIEESFRAGTPETILENLDLSYQRELFFNHPFYDVSPDGKNFVMVKDTELAGQARELRVVQNWFQELERLAPTSGN